jgi:hypothetical protein
MDCINHNERVKKMSIKKKTQEFFLKEDVQVYS